MMHMGHVLPSLGGRCGVLDRRVDVAAVDVDEIHGINVDRSID